MMDTMDLLSVPAQLPDLDKRPVAVDDKPPIHHRLPANHALGLHPPLKLHRGENQPGLVHRPVLPALQARP